jgi:hypothetical protein
MYLLSGLFKRLWVFSRYLVKSHIDYFNSVSFSGVDFLLISIMSSAVAPMSPSHFGPGTVVKDPEINQKVSDVNLLGVAAVIKSMWVFLPKVPHFLCLFYFLEP